MKINIYEAARLISQIKPGDAMTFDYRELPEVSGLGFQEWNRADRILDNVVGSAYEFYHTHDRMLDQVTFRRLNEPLSGNLRSYVSPDRRQYFNMRSDGLYELKLTTPTPTI